MDKSAKSTTRYKWLLAASVLGILYFLFNIKSHLGSPFEAGELNSVGEQSEMLTPVDESKDNSENTNKFSKNNGINNQRRMVKFETRSLNPIRPVARKSFMDTNKFRDVGEPAQPPAEDSNYFYDNSNPMELDPVRAQISKENFDNGGEPGPAPEADPIFSAETSN